MRIAVSISGDAKKARQSSDTILFRKNNFKQYFICMGIIATNTY